MIGSLRRARPEDSTTIADLIRLAFSRQTVATDPLPSALRETEVSVRAHFDAGGGGVVVEGPVACLLWKEEKGGL
ncbi:MAG: hypothetical protein FJX60_07295 [Alphaproteobacteria bacterium]|nr:hypothetical protein [Alphaproteobacteria bacterium]